MKTVLQLGPADHGRPLNEGDFYSADFEPGHKYELIHGRVDVSPLPNLPADIIENWLLDRLKAYARAHPEVINHVTNKARVHAGDREDVSNPEPDIAAYADFPHDRRFTIRWQDISPILVVEVLDPDNPEKDTVRNVDVYHSVASIREYWIVDIRAGADRPSLIVRRRHGRGWRVKTVAFGETYETKLLPGFALVVDPNR